jgi:glycosyltransferase involved in cell wall biosynthesis
MKIGIVSSLYTGWGGSEELWVKTAAIALKNKHQVYISIYDWGTIHESILALERNGAVLIRRPNELASGLNLIKKITFKIKKAVGYNSYLKIFSTDIDLLLISQGGTYDFLWNTQFKEFLLTVKGKKMFIINQFNNEHQVLSMEEILLARTVFNKSEKVLFVSERNKQVSERQLACDLVNAAIISNPIKVPLNKVPYFKTDKIHFAIVGRLDAAIKGHDLLIQAFSDPFFKNKNWVLNIYGNGKDEEYLKALVNYYQLSDKINFRGFQKDIVEIWKNNHLLILTSIGEGTPLTLLEAMACGRSAAVTDVGGNAALIKDDVTGFLIQAPTVSLIVEALQKVFFKQEDLENLGEICLDKVQAIVNSKPEEDLYRLLIGQI